MEMGTSGYFDKPNAKKSNEAENKILSFFTIGAIVAAGAFIIYNKSK